MSIRSPLLLLAACSWAGLAHAEGTALWLNGSPDPTETPGKKTATPEQLAPSVAWSATDSRAIDHLAEELEAVQPLKDVFDGELQILRRLNAALAQVSAVRATDRDLVWRALVLEGYAAHRYFQDGLATDKNAEPYRVPVRDREEILPWVDAIAFDSDRVPTSAEIPDEPELKAYQELRARMLLVPPGAVVAQNLVSGARLVVDGREAPADRAELLPGRHLVAITEAGVIAARQEIRLDSGGEKAVSLLAMAEDLVALAAPLSDRPRALLLTAPVLARLAQAEAPVELILEGPRRPIHYELVDSSAVLAEKERPEGRPVGLIAHAIVGGGWVYDGDYLLQNVDQGAPSSVGTVNAGSPIGSASVAAALGPLALGLGLDVAFPLGDFHDLPVGESRLRARLFPHVEIGHPNLSLAVGPMLPWHLGVGGRLHLPLFPLWHGPVEVMAAYTQGIPLTFQRGEGEPEFKASSASMAWVGVGGRLDTR